MEQLIRTRVGIFRQEDSLRLAQVEQLAHEIDPVLSIHDLRITAGPRHTNVLFDVMVPYGFRLTDSQVRGELSRGVKGLSDKYTAVIEVDHSYVEQREHS